MILSRNQANNGDLGLKVVGGRHSGTRRLGAFITRVKPGSVADAVGQLRSGRNKRKAYQKSALPSTNPVFLDLTTSFTFLNLVVSDSKLAQKNEITLSFLGDEVLEWNGKSMQGISYQRVCDIINASKNDPRIELIVSRSLM